MIVGIMGVLLFTVAIPLANNAKTLGKETFSEDCRFLSAFMVENLKSTNNAYSLLQDDSQLKDAVGIPLRRKFI